MLKFVNCLCSDTSGINMHPCRYLYPYQTSRMHHLCPSLEAHPTLILVAGTGHRSAGSTTSANQASSGPLPLRIEYSMGHPSLRVVCPSGLSVPQNCVSLRTVCPSGLSVPQGCVPQSCLSHRAVCPSGLSVPQGCVPQSCLSLRAVCPSGLSVPQGCLSLRAVCPSGLCVPQGCLSLRAACPSGLPVPQGCVSL